MQGINPRECLDVVSITSEPEGPLKSDDHVGSVVFTPVSINSEPEGPLKLHLTYRIHDAPSVSITSEPEGPLKRDQGPALS